MGIQPRAPYEKLVSHFVSVSISSSFRILLLLSLNKLVKMETFVIDVAPPLPRVNLTATLDELQTSSQLYFPVRTFAISCCFAWYKFLEELSANTLAYRALISSGCSCHPRSS